MRRGTRKGGEKCCSSSHFPEAWYRKKHRTGQCPEPLAAGRLSLHPVAAAGSIDSPEGHKLKPSGLALRNPTACFAVTSPFRGGFLHNATAPGVRVGSADGHLLPRVLATNPGTIGSSSRILRFSAILRKTYVGAADAGWWCPHKSKPLSRLRRQLPFQESLGRADPASPEREGARSAGGDVPKRRP